MNPAFVLMQASEWSLFLGRTHPLLVHLPIGILLIAVLLEVGQRLGKLTVSEATKSFVLLCAAIGAALSCMAGYLLAGSGGYEEELLSRHQWQGIGVAFFAGLAWLSTRKVVQERAPFLSALYFPSFILSVALMFFAGHLGGALTHGDGYLTQHTPEPFKTWFGVQGGPGGEAGEIKPLANVEEAVVYQEIIHPILQTKCTQCHGRSKQKGDLRLDGYEQIVKGGENGPVLVPGNSKESDLLVVCTLPLEDDRHMPPKGKPQLSASQVSLISWWIEQGAPVDKKVSELNQPEDIKPSLQALASGETEAAGGTGGPGAALKALNVPAASEKVIEELEKQKLIVSPVARDQHLIEVSAINAPAFSDAQAELLGKVDEQVVWLKLGKTQVTDKSLKDIAALKNLNKLHLEYTPVTDAGVGLLKDLAYLEYLNLIGTKVSDKIIPSLAAMKGLKSVFLWQSAVSDSGVAELRRLRPDIQVVGGLSEEEVKSFLSAGKNDSLDLKTKAAIK